MKLFFWCHFVEKVIIIWRVPKSSLFEFLGALVYNFLATFFVKKLRITMVRLIFGGFGAGVFGRLFACSPIREIQWIPMAPRYKNENFAQPSVFNRNFDYENRVFSYFCKFVEVSWITRWARCVLRPSWQRICICYGGIFDFFNYHWRHVAKLAYRSSHFLIEILELVTMCAGIEVHPGAGCALKAPFTQVCVYIYIYISYII